MLRISIVWYEYHRKHKSNTILIFHIKIEYEFKIYFEWMPSFIIPVRSKKESKSMFIYRHLFIDEIDDDFVN